MKNYQIYLNTTLIATVPTIEIANLIKISLPSATVVEITV